MGLDQARGHVLAVRGPLRSDDRHGLVVARAAGGLSRSRRRPKGVGNHASVARRLDRLGRPSGCGASLRHFGKEGLLRRTLQWVAEPFRRSRTSLNLHGVSAATATGTITATISRSPLRGLGIEERFGVIEFNIDQLRKELADTNKAIDAARAALLAQLQAADAALRQEVNEVRGNLKETATGNYSTLVFGAAWLAIGLLVATMSPELLRLSADGRTRVIAPGAAIAAGSCEP